MAEEQRNNSVHIPKSVKAVKGSISGWFTWIDLLVLIPLVVIFLLPVMAQADTTHLLGLLPYAIGDLIACLVWFVLIYPMFPNKSKGYQHLWRLFLFLIQNKKYGTKSNPIQNAFPFSEIKDDILWSKDAGRAMVMKLKGVDIEIFNEQHQDSQIAGFGRIFNESESPINLIKFERRQDYQKWADDLQKSLNEEIKVFILDNKSLIKNFASIQKEVRHKSKAWHEVFEEVQDQLPQGKVEQIQVKLENMSINIDNIVQLNNSESYEPVYFIVMINRHIETLQREFNSVVNIMDDLGHSPKILSGTALAAFVNSYYVRNNLKVSGDNKTLERALPSSIEFKWNHYVTKNTVDAKEVINYSRVVNVVGFPTFASRGWLAYLMGSTDSGIVLKTKDYPAERAFDIINKKIKTAEDNYNLAKDDATRSTAQRQLDSLRSMLEDVQDGQTIQQANVFILIMGKDKLDLKMKVSQFKKRVRGMGGFKINTLPFLQKSAYGAFLPTVNDSFSKNDYQTIPTYAIQEGYPLQIDKFQDEGSPIIATTPEGVPVMINFKDRKTRVNSNITIFGKSGKGKSFFSKKIAKDLISQGVKHFVIDPEDEYSTLTKNFKGTIIDLGGRSDNYLNPLQFFGGAGSDVSEFETHLSTASSFLTLVGSLTEEQGQEVPALLAKLYSKFKITPENAYKVPNNKWPVLEDLVALSKKEAVAVTKNIKTNWNPDGWNKGEMQQVYVRLNRALGNSLKARLWNHHTNITMDDSPIITFNIKDLLIIDDKSIVAAQMQTILSFINKGVADNKDKYSKPIDEISQQIFEIERKLKSATTATKKEELDIQLNELQVDLDDAKELWNRKWVHVFVDEAHLLFDGKNTRGAEFLFTMVKRIRKYHGITTIITQNIADFTADPAIFKYTSGIINNSQYTFAFGMSSSDINDLNELRKESGGLSSTEKDILARADRGVSLAFLSETQRMILRTYTTPHERKLIVGEE